MSSASAQGAPAAPAAPKAPQPLEFPGKDKGLVVLGDRPLVAETPESLLDDDTTPTAKFFIRNNGQIPEDNKQGDAWSFRVEGEVDKPLTLTRRRTEVALHAADDADGDGMRRQRPFLLPAGGARQSVDQRRRRLRGVDRRQTGGRAEGGGARKRTRNSPAISARTRICPATRARTRSRAACRSRRRSSRTRCSSGR